MRDFKGMKRQRGRNRSGGPPQGGKPQQNANRAFDSSGPENIKVRGHAQSVYEKYQQLARDAFSSGDRVLAESHLQHAEHYFRLLRLIQPNRPTAEIVARDVFASGFDIDFEDEGGTQFAPEAEAPGGELAGAEGAQPTSDAGETSNDQGRDRPRFDDRGDRGRNQDRYQGDRQQGDRAQGERDRNYADRPQNDRYAADRPQGDRSQGDRNQGDRYQGGGRNQGDRYDRGQGERAQGERNQNQNDRPQGDRVQGDRYQADRSDRYQGDRSQGDRPQSERPQGERQDRPRRDGRDRDRNRNDGGAAGDGRGDRAYESRDTRGDRQGRSEARPEASVEPELFETSNPYPEAVVTEAPAYVEPVAAIDDASSPRLRSEDGGFSEAPAFLQAMLPTAAPTLSDAPEIEDAPARRPRRPRRRADTAADVGPAEDNLPPGPAVESEDA